MVDVALVQCRHCKRAFISAPEDRDYCPPCAARLRELYPLVRSYLRDNERRVFTVEDVSAALNVSVKDINGLVELGLIDAIRSQSSSGSQALMSELKRGQYLHVPLHKKRF